MKIKLVEVCHTSLNYDFGAIGGRHSDDEKARKAFQRHTSDLRKQITQARTCEQLREVLLAWWSGETARRNLVILQPLQGQTLEAWAGLQNWKEARDLALLSLVSYSAPSLILFENKH